jgi:hypothetical protein
VQKQRGITRRDQFDIHNRHGYSNDENMQSSFKLLTDLRCVNDQQTIPHTASLQGDQLVEHYLRFEKLIKKIFKD